MEHLYAEYGEKVYEKGYLKSIKKKILAWCDDNEIDLNSKAKTKIVDGKYWRKMRSILEAAQTLMADIGTQEFDDFIFSKKKLMKR